MGERCLKAAYDRGEPLVEVEIRFRPDVDPVTATVQINAECDDFDLHPDPGPCDDGKA